jgi:hypothetical protein
MNGGRPLHLAERELLESFAPYLELERVRVYRETSRFGRVICFFSRGAAMALGYRIVLPGRADLPTLAHELTHVCQFHRWGGLGYFARGFWNQVILRGLLKRDVYRWEFVPGKAFTDYGMEQQGQIVQDCFDHASPRRAVAQIVSPYAPR